MSEMIERVASAIMSEENPDSRDQYSAMARAAIEAMREPTEAMMLNGEAAIAAEPIDSPAYTGWRAMIDAALHSEKVRA